MKLILLGAPGAGKGTQAKFICDSLDIPHISTGDIFRKNIKEGTPIGMTAKGYIDRGELVPDSVTVEIVRQRLAESDCEKGFLLDGFPRNLYQAEELKKIVGIDAVVDIEVPFERLLHRITGRRVCKACGESFHVDYIGEEKVCKECGGELFQRADDNETTVKARLEVYRKETEPLIDFYKKEGILKSVDGDRPIEIVCEDILKILK